MKIISEEKVKEYAMSESGKFASIDEYTNGLMVGIDFGIEKGVNFAENELQNLAIEFAEWNAKLGFKYNRAMECWYMYKNGHKFTTKQNFDQFIKGKMQ